MRRPADPRALAAHLALSAALLACSEQPPDTTPVPDGDVPRDAGVTLPDGMGVDPRGVRRDDGELVERRLDRGLSKGGRTLPAACEVALLSPCGWLWASQD